MTRITNAMSVILMQTEWHCMPVKWELHIEFPKHLDLDFISVPGSTIEHDAPSAASHTCMLSQRLSIEWLHQPQILIWLITVDLAT